MDIRRLKQMEKKLIVLESKFNCFTRTIVDLKKELTFYMFEESKK